MKRIAQKAGASHSAMMREREPKKVKDTLDKLTDDIKAKIIETCAKVAEIHRIPLIDVVKGSYADGYNAAVADIAAKIREL